MAAARNYSSVARATTLTSGVSGSSTVFAVSETTGFPTPPFTLVADPGRAGEEVVTVTNQVGLNLTVLRGQDGTGAQPHDAGATLRHMATARDYREPADHLALTSDVHGVTGALVGATQTQDLDNKTFSPALTDHTPVTFKQASGQTAPLLTFKDSSGNVTGNVTTAGRVTTPGVDSTKSSTLTGTATDVPLIVKGAASHTAHLMSVRDSSSTELLFIEPNGNLNAKDITGTNITTPGVASSGSTTTGSVSASGRIATPGIDGSIQSVFTPNGTGGVPLVAMSPTGHTVSAFAVRDVATSTSRAGFAGESGNYLAYHGGSATNYLPYKQHAGKFNVQIDSGNGSTNDTISLTSYGFTQTPIMNITVQVNGQTGNESRVGAEITALSASSMSVRTVQMQSIGVSGNQTYTIHWQAIQMTPTSASG
jgi:hypothetical protein